MNNRRRPSAGYIVLLAAVLVFVIAGFAVWRTRAQRFQPSPIPGVTGTVGHADQGEIPPLVLLVGGLALCAYGEVLRRAGSGRASVAWCIAVVFAVAAVSVTWRAWVESHPTRALVAAAAAGLLAVLASLPAEEPARTRAFDRSVLLFVALFAFGLRWGVLVAQPVRSLDPDAETYLLIARGLESPFATGPREPLSIWCVRLCLWLLGDSVTTLRVASIGFSLLAVIACYTLGKRFLGWRVGCLAALLLAWWPEARQFSVRGLRDELLAGLAWLFIAALYTVARRSSPRRLDVIQFILATAAVWLAVLTALVPSLILIGVAVTRGKLRLRHALSAAAFGLLCVAPFAWLNHKHHGDALYSVNIFARGFANMEFAGEPGFPSRKEVERDLFTGRHMTTAEYVFGLHSIGEIVTRVSRGYVRLLDGHYLGPVVVEWRRSIVLFVLYLCGSAMAMLTRPGRYLYAALIVWLGPTAFLAGATRFGLDWRLASPMWAIQAVGFGLATVVLIRGRAYRPLLAGIGRTVLGAKEARRGTD